MSRRKSFCGLVLLAMPLAMGLGCGDDDEPVDGAPPAKIDDLTGVRLVASQASLAWTAPGDDGKEGRCADYDIRIHLQMITDANWNTAIRGDYPAQPQPAGNPEVIIIQQIPTADTYYAAVKAVDEAGNWSPLSNVVELTVGGGGDTTPPGSIDDLDVVFITPSAATLSWTATGDDGSNGTATSYEITFDAGCGGAPQSVSSPPAPGPSGSAERFTVTGLTPSTLYCFTLRAVDESDNKSPAENLTASTPPALLRLTTSDQDDGGPDWSHLHMLPKIAFAHVPRAGESDIYVIDDDGANLAQVTNQAGYETSPTWRPGQNQIAFRANWGTGQDIWMVNFDGTGLTEVVVDEHWNSWPTWSPDGSRLAFGSGREGNTDIWIVDVSGPQPGTLEKVTDDGGADGHPRWSPDGNHFAFIRDFDVWVISYPQRVYRQLTSTAATEDTPAWSADGQWIAFMSDRTGNKDIFVVHVDGGEPIQVTYDPNNDGNPSWSPLANKIAFGTKRSGDGDVYIMEVKFD